MKDKTRLPIELGQAIQRARKEGHFDLLGNTLARRCSMDR